MYGRGGRIGLAILDSDLTIEGDLRRLMPPDIEAHVARVVYPHEVTADSLGAAVEGLEQAIASLLPIRPNVIVWACTSGSFFGGRDAHERLKERMRCAAGPVPVTTASECVVEALMAMGIRRPAVGSPYSPEINRRLDAFLGDYGLEPHRARGFFPNLVDDYTLQDVEEDSVAAFLRDLDRPDADAVVLSCTGLPTASVTPAVEQELGKPVITSNIAIFWNAHRLGGFAPPTSRPCRLLETLR